MKKRLIMMAVATVAWLCACEPTVSDGGGSGGSGGCASGGVDGGGGTGLVIPSCRVVSDCAEKVCHVTSCIEGVCRYDVAPPNTLCPPPDPNGADHGHCTAEGVCIP